MKKCEKTYRNWKSKTERRLSKNQTKRLIELLIADGVAESEIWELKDLFKVDTETSIRKVSKDKTEEEIENWISSLIETFDDTVVELFTKEDKFPKEISPQKSSADLNAIKAGFLSRKHFEEYACSAPLISSEELRKIEEERNRIWDNFNIDEFEKTLEEILKTLN